jgi:hypothetical protein
MPLLGEPGLGDGLGKGSGWVGQGGRGEGMGLGMLGGVLACLGPTINMAWQVTCNGQLR